MTWKELLDKLTDLPIADNEQVGHVDIDMRSGDEDLRVDYGEDKAVDVWN